GSWLAAGTERGTVGAGVGYHGLLLAAQMLGDRGAAAAIVSDIRTIRFDKVRGPDGFVRYGLGADGKTPLAGGWIEWGGEATLVALLERMAVGADAKPKFNRSGKVPDGV